MICVIDTFAVSRSETIHAEVGQIQYFSIQCLVNIPVSRAIDMASLIAVKRFILSVFDDDAAVAVDIDRNARCFEF